jgi:hypothetical protein
VGAVSTGSGVAKVCFAAGACSLVDAFSVLALGVVSALQPARNPTNTPMIAMPVFVICFRLRSR